MNNTTAIKILNNDISFICMHSDFNTRDNIINNEKNLSFFKLFVADERYKSDNEEDYLHDDLVYYFYSKSDNLIEEKGVADATDDNLDFKISGTKNNYIIDIFYKDSLVEQRKVFHYFNDSDYILEQDVNKDMIIFKGVHNYIIINKMQFNQQFDKLEFAKEIEITKDEGLYSVGFLKFIINRNALYQFKYKMDFWCQDTREGARGVGYYKLIAKANNTLITNMQILIDDAKKNIPSAEKQLYYFYNVDIDNQKRLNYLYKIKKIVNKELALIDIDNIDNYLRISQKELNKLTIKNKY